MNMLSPEMERFRAELRDAVEIDIEMRRSRRRIWVRVARFGVPGIVGVLGLSLALAFTGTEAAFAGWSPSPTAATAQETSTADGTCQALLASTPQDSSGASTTGGWSVVTTDVRGPFTLVVYQDGSNGATCLTGPSVTVASESNGNGGSMSVSARSVHVSQGSGTGTGPAESSSVLIGSSSKSITQMSLNHLSSTSQGPFTVVEGQVVDGVTGVALVLSDGTQVQASTGNGWFVAWWPGTQAANSADITTSSGVTSETLTTRPLLPPPPSANGTCSQTADGSTCSSSGASGNSGQ